MFDLDRELSAGKIAALKLLKQAFDDAADVEHDRWQFAIRKAALLAAGVSVSDLRWLIVSHLAEAAHEITKPDDLQRKFRDTPSLALLDGDCFVLTHGGKIYIDNRPTLLDGDSHGAESPVPPRRASRREGRKARRPKRAPDSIGGESRFDTPRPDWRPLEGELYFRDRLVRERGRKAGVFEEFLLGLFDKAQWRQSLSLTLPAGPIETLGQLKECVRRLNDHMLLDTLRFHVYAAPDGPLVSWENQELADGDTCQDMTNH